MAFSFCHHERTGASWFLSERGLLRGTRVQRKTADQQWDNEFIRQRRGVPWILIGEEPEVRVTASTCSGDACTGSNWSERHNRGEGTFRNMMWRGTDRRQDVRHTRRALA